MRLTSWICLLTRAIPAISSALKPLVAHDVKYVEVPQPRHLDLDLFQNLEERIPTIHLGTFSLAKKFNKDYVLLQIRLGTSNSVGTLGDTTGVAFAATVTCADCYITGQAVAITTGVKTDNSILKDIFNFFKDPTEVVINALDLNIEVSLENFGGHFEFDIAFEASGTYTVQLYKSETPVGVQLSDDDKVGLLLTLEMTFTISAKIDFTTGFDIVFPPGTNFILNPLTGEIVSMSLGGAKVSSIPFQFKKGSACITATLRLKVQLGVGLKVLGKGFDFEAGLFWDPAIYKACLTYEPAAACQWSLTETFAEDSAAYARAVVDLNFAKLSAGPTKVTTYYTATLPSQCLKDTPSKTTPHSTTVKKTTPAHQETTPTPKHTSTTKHTSTKKPTSTKHTTHTSPHETGSSKHSSSHKSSTHTSSTHKSSSDVSSSYKSSTHTSSTHKSSPASEKSSTHSHSSSKSKSHSGTGTKSHSGTKIHTHSSHYGNYSFTKTLPSDTDTVTLPTNTDTDTNTYASPTGTSTGDSGTETSSSDSSVPTDTDTNIDTTPTPTDTDSGTNVTATITSSPTDTDTSLQTITVWTPITYTITSCASQYSAWCPYSLATEITLTKTIIQYTTICPLTQSSFPSYAPAEITAPATAPVVVVTNPVTMEEMPTPIVNDVNVAPPLETFTYTIVLNGTTAYPVVNNAAVRTVSVTYALPSVTLTSDTPLATDIITSGVATPTFTALAQEEIVADTSTSNGIGPVIYSVGGFTSPEAKIQTSSSEVPNAASTNAGVVATPSQSGVRPSVVQVQGSGARSSVLLQQGIVAAGVAGVCLFSFVFVLL